MSCIIEDVTDVLAPSDFDKALGDLLVGHKGNTELFLGSIFDFLKRKTNFFKEADAKGKVLSALRQTTGEPAGLKAGFLAGCSAKHNPVMGPQAAADPVACSVHETAQDEQGESLGGAETLPTEVPVATAGVSVGDALDTAAMQDDQEGLRHDDSVEEEPPKPKGLKPNTGRGADLDQYSWTQTLSEVTLLVPVPPGTKGRQLDVQIAKTHLRVGLKGDLPIINGDLAEAIKPDDCLWNLVDNTVELTLTKAEGMHWWKAVLAGDQEIDVQAVEPENSKLSDLDPETRTTVEKMMFDQRQKALGLPTSEELNKQEMLRKFMAAHPEMDFSQAKIM